MTDNVNCPSHYTCYEGVEVIEITRQMDFNLGNAVKHIARAGHKDPSTEIEDLQKAIFYIKDELKHNKFLGEGDDLENEWGEKVYRLSSQMNTNREEAMVYICLGTEPALRYAINFLEREIEDLS